MWWQRRRKRRRREREGGVVRAARQGLAAAEIRRAAGQRPLLFIVADKKLGEESGAPAGWGCQAPISKFSWVRFQRTPGVPFLITCTCRYMRTS